MSRVAVHSLVVLTMLAAGCSSQASDDLGLNDHVSETTDSSGQSLTGQKTPDIVLDEDTGSSDSVAPSDSAPASGSSDDPSAAIATGPVEVERSWAVVLAGASSPGDEILEATIADAGAAGFEATVTNCDLGAAEAVQMAPTGAYTVSIYFETEDAATAALEVLEGQGLLGTLVQIEKSCPE